MTSLRPHRSAYLVPFVLAFPFLAGANGDGCSSVPIGSGASDGGASSDGSTPSDAGGACLPGDCAGQSAPTDAKLCSDGSSVARSACTREPTGQCAWDFPACPATDAATACPAYGCAPRCTNGVLKDSNGCDTCQCAPVPDGGSCGNDADCGTTQMCGFPIAQACAATGTCFPKPQVTCNAFAAGCACDGSLVNVACNGLPTGYAPRQLLHTGECTTAADGGACCPATWSLYGCTFPDGGAGFACHNPALGCASSSTCGQGCDAVVGGRCGR